jgi:hypothetical protein
VLEIKILDLTGMKLLRMEEDVQKKLQNLYSSSNIIRQIKSRRMRWARLLARMVEERKLYNVLMVKLE